MNLGYALLLLLAVVYISLGFVFIYYWRKSPSDYEGASSAEMAHYLRKNDRNALLGVLFVYWTLAAALITYCILSIRPS